MCSAFRRDTHGRRVRALLLITYACSGGKRRDGVWELEQFDSSLRTRRKKKKDGAVFEGQKVGTHVPWSARDGNRAGEVRARQGRKDIHCRARRGLISVAEVLTQPFAGLHVTGVKNTHDVCEWTRAAVKRTMTTHDLSRRRSSSAASTPGHVLHTQSCSFEPRVSSKSVAHLARSRRSE